MSALPNLRTVVFSSVLVEELSDNASCYRLLDLALKDWDWSFDDVDDDDVFDF